MKLKQALAFCQLYGKLKTRIIPVSVAFKLNKIYIGLRDNADFYRNTFNDIIENYSQKNDDGSLKYSEDGSMILIKKECLDECDKRLRELEDLEVAQPDVKLSIEELEPLELSIEDVENLTFFIE